MKNTQKGFSVVEILIVLLVASLIGGAGWYVWQTKNKDNSPQATVSQQKESDIKKTEDDTKAAPHYLVVKEWKLSIPIASNSSVRFTYTLGNSAEAEEQIATLTDNDIAKLESATPCAAQVHLARSKDGQFYNSATGKREKLPDGVRGAYTKLINGYYYRVLPGHGCGYDETTNKKIDELYKSGFSAFKWDLSNLEISQP